jgi:glycosyltransferase involved in cell wall biosynthesis
MPVVSLSNLRASAPTSIPIYFLKYGTRDGENSMLVSPLNYEMLVERIIRVLLDAELRDKLVKNGRKTAEAYSRRNTALEEFYSGILGEAKKV